MKNVLPLFALIALAFGAPGAHAATLTVTTTADSGAGSLRAAIAAAAAGDTIQFAAALNGQTITLTSAQLLIDKDLIIQGPGANQLTVKRSTAGGIPVFRIFRVASSHTVTIDGITINNGRAQGSFPGNSGAGIYNDGSVLTIANCIINGNTAGNGGGIFNDATNSGSAQLTIQNSILSGNVAGFGGAGIYNYGYGDFNPFSVFASVEMSDSTISGNSAVSGAGIYTDGSFDGNAFLIITSSTFSGNTASDSGGGIYNDGEEVESGNAYVSILNTTFSGNSAGLGGAIMDDGMEQGLAVLGIGNCTFSDNSAGVGGGVYIKTPFSGSGFGIGHTILKAGASGENIHVESGPVSSAGYNLSSDDGSGVLTAAGDQTNTDPMIGPLQDNGGPTFTHALLLGSTGINAGNPTYTPPPDFDQRGTGFPRIFNTRIDIGSFEYQMVAPIPTPSPIPTASPTPTATVTPTPIASPTPIHTPTPTATPIASPTPAHTPTPTATPITSPIPTPTPTATAAATPTPTPTPPPSPTPRTTLLNISTRLRVLTGDNALIGGFIVTGNVPKRVIVRAIGPSLTNLGIPGALVDPVLELHGPGAFATISNNNWRDTQEAEIEATGVAPSNDLESAIVATLPPGAYTAIVSGNNGGTGVGVIEAYDLAPAAGAQLANISTRGFVDSGDNVMIGGFILGSGSTTARILIRAIGPSLAAVGVPNALADPTLELHNSNGDIIATNDDWRDTQQGEIAATGIPPSDDRESAIIGTLVPGAYTAILLGKNDATGVAAVEAYQLTTPTPTPSPTPPTTPTPTPTSTPTPSPAPPAKFGSLASRAVVGTGDAIVLNTFIITGPDAKRVIVRGLGPSLVKLGVPNVLADPALELRTSTGTLIRSNDDWRSDQEAEIIATTIPPTNDLEAAIVATLSPGSYTVVLRGINNGTGHGINDLHDVVPGTVSSLTAIGTRANMLTGEDLLISEIAMPQGGDILLRVLGPSLASAGVANVMANPTLELRNSDGTLLMANDNWRDDPAQEALILATGIPPTNDLEAAMVMNLPPGSHMALGSGRNSTIGIGYLQSYSLPHSGPELKLTP